MSGELTEAETELFELLVFLIESYESRHYTMGKSTPVATLESLMHEFEVKPVSLVEIIGSVDIVREVIQGQRRISKAQAESLAKLSLR